MDRQQFEDKIREAFSGNEYNYIPEEKALAKELISAKIFEEPLIAIADANDPSFQSLKRPDVVGEHFMLPTQWLPEARSVVSFFFPFTEIIRSGNRANDGYPSKGWLNGRIEGQSFIDDFSACAVRFLESNHYKAFAPSIDKRFSTKAEIDRNGTNTIYTSNWSERHVAYICGLGTFGLSKGLITEKGMAGRFTSVITDLHLPPDSVKYKRYDENCIMCGRCIENCPVGAISLESGKNHKLCSSFLDSVKAENAPWYGCGKCQVNVPCEYDNPQKA